MQNYEGLAAGFAADFDIVQCELCSDASAEGFGNSFLCGETRGVAAGGLAMGIAVGLLRREKASIYECTALSLDGGVEARDFHDVHTDADDFHGWHIAASMSRTACSKPTNKARATILWPILSSSIYGSPRMSAMLL